MKQPDLDKLFTYYPPKDDQPHRYEAIQRQAHLFACIINGACPDSREKSLAITSIENAVMWANASIAINEAE
jgi:hypothetical protein